MWYLFGMLCICIVALIILFKKYDMMNGEDYLRMQYEFAYLDGKGSDDKMLSNFYKFYDPAYNAENKTHGTLGSVLEYWAGIGDDDWQEATFGGNHLGCAAALAVLDVFEQEHLVDNANEVGSYLITELKKLQTRQPHILEVRGRGLMVGVVMDIPHKEVRSQLIHEQHVFTGCAGTNILRILPPLIITKADVDDFIFRLENVLKTIHS